MKNYKSMKKVELSFFEGFIFGILGLTIFLISQYGFNFHFFSAKMNFIYFQESFRPVTLIILCSGMIFLYRFCVNKSFFKSFLYTLIIWCYYDIIFLLGNICYNEEVYHFYFIRDFFLLVISLLFLQFYKIIRNRKNVTDVGFLIILLILLLPLEYYLVRDYSMVENWYLVQYSNLSYSIRDFLFKIFPYLPFYVAKKRGLKKEE